jgi:EF hand
MIKSLTTGIALLGLAAMSQAADSGAPQQGPQAGGPPGGMRMNPEERFKTMDTNKDGKLSLSEYVAGAGQRGGPAGSVPGGNAGAPGQGGAPGMGNREERFKSQDTNKDGFLSLDEYKAGRANMGGGQRGRDGNGKSRT